MTKPVGCSLSARNIVYARTLEHSKAGRYRESGRSEVFVELHARVLGMPMTTTSWPIGKLAKLKKTLKLAAPVAGSQPF